jgi:predicted phage terminase large subunit-like protein
VNAHLPDLLDIEAELARRSLHDFLRFFAWPALTPATPFVDNWHIGAICEHLEAVARGQIKRLIINMPFRMLKSTLVSQSFPAWDWINNPSRQFLTAAYAGDIATRDAVDARRIIESPKYRRAFGHIFTLTTDQNVKKRYENDRRGRRIVTSTGAAGTGFGGDIRIIDDPVSAMQADSDVAIAESIEWWRGTMATRANDAATGQAVLTHQRLNARDLTGYLLAEEKGWEHLVLPMRFDPELAKTTSLGFVDPRKTAGELLHPQRLPEAAVAELEGSLGAYHTNAQLQQNPAPRGGVIFERKHWRYWRALPQLDETVISVDCAFKDLQSSDYVAIQAWGSRGADSFLRHRVKERLGFSATVAAVRAVRALFPDATAVLVEDKANGSAVIETLRTEIPGLIPVTPDGGKVARAYAMQPEQEAGNIWLPDPTVDPKIEEFLTEVSAFPGAPHDDEVDAMTQYVNWKRQRRKGMALHDLMREQFQTQRAAQQESLQHASAAAQQSVLMAQQIVA